MAWTQEQQRVIQNRSGNMLVSAAAGSGKTAVLVERIVQTVIDENANRDIDRMLVVTFTNAAAAEMKERIAKKLDEKLEKSPENSFIQKQLMLLNNAQISTIHSFCLYVIRNNFNCLDIDPTFRLAEEAEMVLLKSDVLSELLERKYKEAEKTAESPFISFVESYSTGKTDLEVEEVILRLYEFSRSNPEPTEWLISLKKSFDLSSIEELNETEIMKYLIQYLQTVFSAFESTIETCINLSSNPGGPYMYTDALESDVEILDEMKQCSTYLQYADKFNILNWKRMSPKKDDSVDADIRENVKTIRNKVKDEIKDLKDDYFFASPDEIVDGIRRTKPVIDVLIDLVIEFSEYYSEAKKSSNIMDFGDLEHNALKILAYKEDGQYMPTAVAMDLKDYFQEIFIDEYQDSNLIQETILKLISREDMAQPNTFRVGDVKQSIYKFRLAKPELFIEKYGLYQRQQEELKENSPCHMIELNKNFRSRIEVIDFVNFVFNKIMDKKLGGIDYNEKAALYQGDVNAYLQLPNDIKQFYTNDAEIMVLDIDEENDENDYTVREAEARLVATKIKQIMGANGNAALIYDKEEKGFRKICYSDIVILLRATTGWAEIFENVLNEQEIPVYTETSVGYFDAIEVQVILNLLSIIDNPKQDIPLVAVLRSPIAGFTSNELAVIKSEYKKQQLSEGIYLYLTSGSDERIKAKLNKFIEMLNDFRMLVPYMNVHEIIWYALDKTGYYNYISAMPSGEIRRANIDMLVQRAVQYEKINYKGLFNFIRYIQKIREYKIDFGQVGEISDKFDAVRIMSIHKSKGLEFPVVFLSGTNKKFNLQDTRKRLVINADLGIGIDFIDYNLRTKKNTLFKNVIAKKITLENLEEEIRVLYVAMTRAKEKLIVTAAIKNYEKYEQNIATRVENKEGSRLSYYNICSATSYFEWMLMAFIFGKKNGEEFVLNKEIDVMKIKEVVSKLVQEQITQDIQKSMLNDIIYEKDRNYSDKVKQLEENLKWVYPHIEETKLHSKFTVTELKKQSQSVDEEYSYKLIAETPEIVMPRFMCEAQEVKPAVKGTIMHKFLQYMDFEKINSRQDIEEAVRVLCENNKLKQEEALCIDVEQLYIFSQQPLFNRMREASICNKLYKEKQFIIGIDANEIDKKYLSNETILVQGVIDAYFEESDEIVVVDYKTDKINDVQRFIELYNVQLEYYKRTVEKILHKRVKQAIIYSLFLGKEIAL